MKDKAMIVKNALKIKDYVEESVDIHKEDGDKDFIQEMLCEFKSSGKKEYGEKISVEKLNSLLPEDVRGKYDVLATKAIKREERHNYFIMAFIFFPLLGMLCLEKNEEVLKIWITVGVMFLCLSMMMIEVWSKKEKVYKKSFNIDVKDDEGKRVKAIWFLYHNLSFRDDKEKNEFIKDNYSQFNYYLKIDAELCLEEKIKPSDYLEDFKERMLKSLEESYQD